MRKKYGVLVLVMIIPFLLSLWAAHIHSIGIGIGAVLSVLLLVGSMPFCRRRENLWLFVVGIYAFLPINHLIVKEVLVYIVEESSLRWLVYPLTYLECFLILISVEEVLLGLVGRLLWRKQYKLVIS